MVNSYFLRKKLINIFKISVIFLLDCIAAIYRFFFAKRAIVFVSNRKIKTVHVGLFSQALFLAFAIFAGNIFMQSLQYDKILSDKEQKIVHLQSVNHYFEGELNHINAKIEKVNNYLSAVTGHKDDKTALDTRFKEPKSFKKDKLSQSNQKALEEIKKATFALRGIRSIAHQRIANIESAISNTGLPLRKMPRASLASNKANTTFEQEVSLNKKGDLLRGQGGPLSSDEYAEVDNTTGNELEKHLEKAQFASEFDRLFLLEKLVSVMPLSRPMKNYYISSGFGKRSDPMNHGRGIHKGLDFVGALNGKIYSPASGRVVLARKYGHYGNAIFIDHGFGITTRYGHLSSIDVKTGQTVKKGQIIAAQGSTGRSTGQHLHYEVRYRGVPLNPKKFLEAGDFLLKDVTT